MSFQFIDVDSSKLYYQNKDGLPYVPICDRIVLIIILSMNYGQGYNQPYVQGYNQPYVQGGVTVNTYGKPQPYYNQPMIMQQQPQVIIVEDRYAQNNMAAAEAALCACCCLELLCCCLLWLTLIIFNLCLHFYDLRSALYWNFIFEIFFLF